MEGQLIMTVKVRRMPGDRVDEYRVQARPGMSVFNVLNLIRSTIDPTLAVPISCRIGKCDICLISVNGKTRWACTEPARDGMLLEPLDRYEVIKDLVIDWERRAGIRSRVPAAAAGEASGR